MWNNNNIADECIRTLFDKTVVIIITSIYLQVQSYDIYSVYGDKSGGVLDSAENNDQNINYIYI